MAFEIEDFQRDVIEQSRKVPVLVDFWAPWCGPCRVLGPVLERLAEQSNGDWKLAKVDTDENPSVSRSYGIRGIPSVKLFVDGAVVDEFTGALPEYAVKQWLEKALPSENKKRVERAEMEMSVGNVEEAGKLLEAVLKEEPENPKARILMARLVVFEDPERAAELVSGGVFAGPRFIQIEEAVKTVAHLLSISEDDMLEGGGRSDYAEAIAALKRRDFEQVLEKFIQVIQTDRYYDDDGSRKACVALFTLLGDEHPAVREYRRTFDMALY
ncbi:MAG: thioredoxin [Rhodothermales bacterium]